MSDRKEGAGDSVSRNTIAVEVGEARNKNSAINGWPDFLIDSTMEQD